MIIENTPEHIDRMARINNTLNYLKVNNFAPPEEYRKFGGLVAGYLRLKGDARKNAELVIAEQAYATDMTVGKEFYSQNIASEIFRPVTQIMSQFRWDIKQHAIENIQNVVKFTRDFAEENPIKLKNTSTMASGIGLYGGLNLGYIAQLEGEGGFFDVYAELKAELARQMGLAVNQRLFTGRTKDFNLDDSGQPTTLTGFLNNSDNQTMTISSATTYGNIITGIKSGLSKLKKTFSNNIIMLANPGVIAQMQDNYPTYGRYTEWDEFKRTLVGGNNPIKQVWASDSLGTSAPTVTTQKVYLMALDSRYMSRDILLPLQTVQRMSKVWVEDKKEVMLLADRIRFKWRHSNNPFPIVESGNITTETTGMVAEARVA